jgi:hypothetical protein
MFERIIQQVESRSHDLDSAFLHALNQFAQDLKRNIEIQIKQTGNASLHTISKEIDNIVADIFEQTIASPRTASTKVFHESTQIAFVKIHNIKNVFSKFLADEAAKAKKKMDMAEEPLVSISAIKKSVNGIKSKEELNYPAMVSAALFVRKLFADAQTVSAQVLYPKTKNTVLSVQEKKEFTDKFKLLTNQALTYFDLSQSERDNLVTKQLDSPIQTAGTFSRHARAPSMNEAAIPAKLDDQIVRSKAMTLKSYCSKNLDKVDKVISKYITAYLEYIKIKESKSTLDEQMEGLTKSWKEVSVAQNQFKTREDLKIIAATAKSPNRNAAVILTRMLKNSLQIPVSLENQIDRLMERKNKLEMMRSNSPEMLKNFRSTMGITLSVIVDSLKISIAEINRAQLNVLNKVMNVNFLNEIAASPKTARANIQAMITANTALIAQHLERASQKLDEIDNFLGIKAEPLKTKVEGRKSSVSMIFHRLATLSVPGQSHSASSSPTNGSNPKAFSTQASTPTSSKIMNYITSFYHRSSRDNLVSKVTGTADEMSILLNLKENPLASDFKISVNESEKNGQSLEVPLPGVVDAIKTPRR